VRDQRIINLNFHGVGSPGRELEPDEDGYWISEDAFVEIVDLVRDRGDVRLTFDDGNASDVEIVLPALRSRQLHGSFFPVAERMGQPGSVDREGLRQLVNDGMAVGSHGMRHLAWRHMTDDQLDDELVAAREVIAEQAGTPVATAACPLGSYDRRVLSRLRKLGYAQVFTSDRALARPSGWLQPRFSIRSSDDAATVRHVLGIKADRRAQLLADARVALKRWR
jgi:peptidoglycan/xylan/chitin deacetylase (PgdA/CDA1 family)